MKWFKEEAVLGTLACRLVPPNDKYPDCECEVILTEEHFYVLEDNFDGTYNEHFAVPMKDIVRLTVYDHGMEPKDAPHRQERTLGPLRDIAVMVVGFLAGLIVLPGRQESRQKALHLRLVYRDAEGNEEHVFFNECAGSIAKLCQTLEKYKARRVLTL